MKLQKTLSASRAQPWLGSIQYSPAAEPGGVCESGAGPDGFLPTGPRQGRDLTIRQVRVVAVQLTAYEARTLSCAGRAPHLLQFEAQRRERRQHLLQAALRALQGHRAPPSPPPAQPVQLGRGTLSGGEGGRGESRDAGGRDRKRDKQRGERQGRQRDTGVGIDRKREREIKKGRGPSRGRDGQGHIGGRERKTP